MTPHLPEEHPLHAEHQGLDDSGRTVPAADRDIQRIREEEVKQSDKLDDGDVQESLPGDQG